ncbi:hypothetical protein BvCmsSINP017_01946 [Escherichia coli]|nr:hypothetical protein BvCmsSINP013_02193 [Escherichia coli]GDT57233.1 hypothetical protein BvCmsSINP017_01946 [Escherichia coli]
MTISTKHLIQQRGIKQLLDRVPVEMQLPSQLDHLVIEPHLRCLGNIGVRTQSKTGCVPRVLRSRLPVDIQHTSEYHRHRRMETTAMDQRLAGTDPTETTMFEIFPQLHLNTLSVVGIRVLAVVTNIQQADSGKITNNCLCVGVTLRAVEQRQIERKRRAKAPTCQHLAKDCQQQCRLGDTCALGQRAQHSPVVG